MSGAITATVTAVAAMTVAQVFTAVAITGAVVGAVGMVTGSKELKIAGMILGVVGGVGGLATSAGLFAGEAAVGLAEAAGGAGAEISNLAALGATEQLAATAAGGAGAELSNLAVSNAEIMGAASAAPAAEFSTVSDVINHITGKTSEVPGAASPEVYTGAQGQATGPQGGPELNAPSDVTRAAQHFDTQVAQAATPIPSAPATNVPPPPEPTGGFADVKGLGAQAAAGAGDMSQLGGQAAATAASGQKIPGASIFGDIAKFVKDNNYVVAAGLHAGGAFLAGATSSLTPAQVKALEAQAAANQAAANLSTQQAQNMASGIPAARRLAVTGVPAGMINQPKAA